MTRQHSNARLKLVEPASDEALDMLAEHCIAARAIVDQHGTPAMRRLIDLLLFEVGSQIAVQVGAPSKAVENA